MADAPPTHERRGGFHPDMLALTTDGLVSVSDLSPGQRIYALEPTTRVMKCKRIDAVEPVDHDGRLVEVVAKRTSMAVHPEHPILHRTDADPAARFIPAGDLTDRYQYRFVNRWRPPTRERLRTVDLTDLLEEYEICATPSVHGHTVRATLPDGCEPIQNNQWVGYVFDPPTFTAHREVIEEIADDLFIRWGRGHRRRPFIFDGDDFLELLGWYVTEGSVYTKSDRNTASVKIAQKRPEHRDRIRSLLQRMGIEFRTNDGGFRFGSLLYGQLLERLAGTGSYNKRLPSLVWDLPPDQQALLLETLMAGDGNRYRTYYTASDRLGTDVCRLCVELGMKPRHMTRDGVWSISVRWVNDGFLSNKHVQTRPYTGPVYQLAVVDYPAVMVGRHGKFQWVGANQVT